MEVLKAFFFDSDKFPKAKRGEEASKEVIFQYILLFKVSCSYVYMLTIKEISRLLYLISESKDWKCCLEPV